MQVRFSIDDLRTPESLERVLRQFQSALGISTTATSTAPDLNKLIAQLAPMIRSELQAGGDAPLNLQSLLPSQGNGQILEDTHANRLTLYPPTNYPVGTVFFETDRLIVYVVYSSSGSLVWKYVAGEYYDTFAARPTDLTTNDIGYLYIPTEHLHWCRWSGSAWKILDDNSGTFIDSARALGTGWQLCDGTATSYLTISGADLAQTAFTTPDENSGASGVYHKSIAAYTGTINAATAGTLSGSTANTTATNQNADLGPTTDKFTLDAGGSPAVTGFTNPHNHTQNAHNHAVGTLVVDAAGQPRNMGVLRYFRR